MWCLVLISGMDFPHSLRPALFMTGPLGLSDIADLSFMCSWQHALTLPETQPQNSEVRMEAGALAAPGAPLPGSPVSHSYRLKGHRVGWHSHKSAETQAVPPPLGHVGYPAIPRRMPPLCQMPCETLEMLPESVG